MSDKAEARFDAETRSVASARHFIEDTLGSWGTAENLVWAAAQAVTELASNAVIHAATAFSVAVSHAGEALRIEVSDGSVRRPRPRHYGTDATTGRGLGLVGALSVRWGTDRRDGGKTVWCLLEPRSVLTAVEPDLDAYADDVEMPEPVPGAPRNPTNSFTATPDVVGRAA